MQSFLQTTKIFPVWAGSVSGPVQFKPLARKERVKIFHDARRFERQTREPGKQDGAIGRNGILILQAMLFDFIDFVSGQLDPSYRAIAEKANMSVRSVARGLEKLKAAGVLNWLRRCAFDPESRELVQQTNAYAVLSQFNWKGFQRTAPAPRPDYHGQPEKVPDALASAAAELDAGNAKGAQRALELGEPKSLAAALARLGKLRRPAD